MTCTVLQNGFGDGSNTREAIAGEFREPIDSFKDIVRLCGTYGSESYDGYATVFFETTSGEFFEVAAAHCSCYGLEDQWTPSPVTLAYIRQRAAAFATDHRAHGREALIGFVAQLWGTNRIRVLVLDDDTERHGWVDAKHARDEVVHAYRYSEAIALLTEERFDWFYIDHDLADLINDADWRGPSGMYSTARDCYFDGRDVVDWLARNPERCPPHIYIHSWSDHAKKMERVARNIPGVRSVTRKQAPV